MDGGREGEQEGEEGVSVEWVCLLLSEHGMGCCVADSAEGKI